MTGPAVLFRVLRAEGPAAVLDRVRDRLEEWLRRRAFRRTAEVPPGSTWPVLVLSPAAPVMRLGGVQAQLASRREATSAPFALLYPEKGAYRLELAHGGLRCARALSCAAPPPVGLHDAAFERAVAWAVRQTGARALHVEGVSGLPLGSLLELGRGGLRLILALHDFGLHCVRPHLFEAPDLRFCGVCRDLPRCARCLGQDLALAGVDLERRRALAAELWREAEALVFPSEFLRRAHTELYGVPPCARERVIAPVPPAPVPAARRPRPPGHLHHVACVGWVHAHKGALVVEEVVRRLRAEPGPPLRFSVYGGGDARLLLRLRRLGMRVRGYYRGGSLGRLLARDHVDVAILPSIVPESYSLVLSECLAAGVPVLAFDLGAVGERIRNEGGGRLVLLESGAAGLARAVGELAQSGAPAPAVLSALPDARRAAESWGSLYRELGLES